MRIYHHGAAVVIPLRNGFFVRNFGGKRAVWLGQGLMVPRRRLLWLDPFVSEHDSPVALIPLPAGFNVPFTRVVTLSAPELAAVGDASLTCEPPSAELRLRLSQARHCDALYLRQPEQFELAAAFSEELLKDEFLRQTIALSTMSYRRRGKRWLEVMFKSETGITPAAFRNIARVFAALRRLAAGASVNEVSSSLGYGYPSSFIVMFRNHTGRTPARMFEVDGYSPPPLRTNSLFPYRLQTSDEGA